MGQKVRTALLCRVFDDGKDRQFDAKLARVCVLFEDLRIEEIRGLAERSLPALDILDPEKETWLSPVLTGQYRQFYSIRRSLATLREFEEAIRLIRREMNSDPALRLTFRDLTDEAPAAWDAAIQFSTLTERCCRRYVTTSAVTSDTKPL
jgi:hypothetical protein